MNNSHFDNEEKQRHVSYMQSIQLPFTSFLYNFNRQLENSSDMQERQHSSQIAN